MRCFRACAADLRRDGGFRRHQRSDPVSVNAPKHGLPGRDALSRLFRTMDPGLFAAARCLGSLRAGRRRRRRTAGRARRQGAPARLPSRLAALASASRGSCFGSSANRFPDKAAIAYPLDTQPAVADCGEKLHDLDPSQRIRGASDAVASEATETGAEISDRNRLAQWQARLMKYSLRGKALEFGPRRAPSANPHFTVRPTSGCAPYRCGRSGGGSGRRLRPEATRRNRRRGGQERPE